MERRWFAIYTRPKWEKKVSALLAEQGIEIYCPVSRVVRQWSDRKKSLIQPLFPSYVFAKLDPTAMIKVRQTAGVINFVHHEKKPAVIRNSEIEAIRRFLKRHTSVSVEKIRPSLEDKVRITGGPLHMFEGRIIKVLRRTVKLSLVTLGYALVAEVKTSNIEILSN